MAIYAEYQGTYRNDEFVGWGPQQSEIQSFL